MRDTIRRLIDATLHGVILDEARAGEFAELASQCEQEGGVMIAATLCSAARNYRIRGMKGRAEAEALSVRYALLLDGPPPSSLMREPE